MVKTWYDKDLSFDAIKDEKIAVIGYGSQGQAQASNLRDSGLNIVVGLRAKGKSWKKAVKEKHKVMKDVKREMRKWSEDELFELLSPASNGELMIKLNRSAMSIHMRRGEFVPSFMSWAISKGYDSSKITPSIVKQFQEKKDEDS